MKSKLLEGLIKRMDNIFEEKERIFQDKYEVLGQMAVWSVNDTPEEDQLSLELAKVFEAIDKEVKRLGIAEQKPEIPAVQGNLLLDR